MRLRSLSRRFVTIMLASALVLAVAAAGLGYHLARQRIEADVRTTLEGVMTAIEDTVAMGVWANDQELLRELVNGLIRHVQIDAVLVFDATENALRTATDPGRSLSASELRPEPSGNFLEHRLYSPFDESESEYIGRLVLRADAGYLHSTVRREAVLLGVVLLGVVLVLGVLLYTLTLRLVVQPMSQLAGQLAAMEPGGAERLQVGASHAEDEIGTVVSAANRLLDANQSALASERALREEVAAMEARYRQIFDHTSAGIFLLTPDYRLINSNRATSELFDTDGSGVRRIAGQDFFEALFVDPVAARNLVADARRTGQTTSADLQVRGREGRTRWVHCLITIRAPATGVGQLIEGVVYDVTQRRLVESEFAYMVEHDALTGLKSRAFFHKVLRHYVERARTIHAPVALVFVDLDQFKLVNDTYGHTAGDRVLVECARRLQELLLRSSDLAARLGGDEFTIVLDGVGADEQTAHDLARRIVRAMNQPIDIGADVRVRVGASVGLASFPLHAADSDELVRAADRAMYEVKRLGKGSWRAAGSTTALAG